MAYISDVTPKAYYDEDQAAYFVSVTTCVKLVTDISAPSLAVTATLADIQVAADGVSTEHLYQFRCYDVMECLFVCLFCFMVITEVIATWKIYYNKTSNLQTSRETGIS